MDKVLEFVPVVLAAVGGLTVTMTLLAPLTKTKFDDKAAGFLAKAMKVLNGFAHDSVKKDK